MVLFFFFKQETAYEMRISDWSSDVCSSDLFVILVDVEIVFIVVVARKNLVFLLARVVVLRLLERHRLLRLENRFGFPRGAAFDAGDGIVLPEIVEARCALRAATFRAPFRLDHVKPRTFQDGGITGDARQIGGRLAIAKPRCQKPRAMPHPAPP